MQHCCKNNSPKHLDVSKRVVSLQHDSNSAICKNRTNAGQPARNYMKNQKTALEILRELMKQKGWYRGSEITRRDAWYYKNAEITEATAGEVLKKLGWTQKTVWEEPKNATTMQK